MQNIGQNFAFLLAIFEIGNLKNPLEKFIF